MVQRQQAKSGQVAYMNQSLKLYTKKLP